MSRNWLQRPEVSCHASGVENIQLLIIDSTNMVVANLIAHLYYLYWTLIFIAT